MTTDPIDPEKQRKRDFIARLRASNPNMFPTAVAPKVKPAQKAVTDYSTDGAAWPLSPLALATFGIVERPEQSTSEGAA
jgi:hypothetical protein